MKLLESYKVGDIVQVLISDAKYTNIWVDGIVVKTGIYIQKNANNSISYPTVTVKYLRNYCRQKSSIMELYEAECTSTFYYQKDIRLKMKYQLVKTYPGSPKIGTIICESHNSLWEFERPSYEFTKHTRDQIINNPEFWQPVVEQTDLTIDDVKDFIHFETYRLGDRNLNIGESGIILRCDEFKFVMNCGYHRSSFQNRKICLDALQGLLNSLPNTVKQRYKNE